MAGVSFFSQMLSLQVTLFLLIFTGIVLKRLHIMTEDGQKCLSDLTINLILPCNIIVSFLGDLEITRAFFRNCMVVLAVSMGIQLFSIFVGKYFFFRFKEHKQNIFTYGLIVSNSSFIGLPIIDSLYGSLGVLYTSLFQIPVRITMWSSGLSLFTSTERKQVWRKLAAHPCIVAVVIGLIFLLFSIKLPEFLERTMTSISGCMVPVSMLAIGGMLSESRWKQFLDPSVLYYCLIRLVVYPLMILAVLRGGGMERMAADVTVLLSGMPMAGTTAILADKYGYNSAFASQCIFVSTGLSIITLPLLSLFL